MIHSKGGRLDILAAAALAVTAAAVTLAGPPTSSPRNTASHAVLVAEDEPGTPLTVRGTVVQPDGVTPAPGVRLYVYNTDAGGVYSKEGDDREHSLEGWLVTAADGSYSFRTIRPGSYPGSRIPAHVHFVLETASGATQRETLQFLDDPFLSERRQERARAAGTFGSIRPLEPAGDGGLACRFDIRLDRPAPSAGTDEGRDRRR